MRWLKPYSPNQTVSKVATVAFRDEIPVTAMVAKPTILHR